jgi:cytochrome P450 family 135
MTATTAPPGPISAAIPPGPRLPVAIQTIAFGRYRHRWLPVLRRRYGDVFMLRIAPHARRLVMLSRPEDIKAIFTSPASVMHAGEGNAILGPIMGAHSVLLLDETAHQRVRQLLMPAFHGSALRGYRDMIGALCHAEAASWPIGRTFGMHRRMQALTLEVILQVVFGVTDAQRLATLRPLVGRILDVSPIVMLGSFYPWLGAVPPWRSFRHHMVTLDRLLYAEIAERRSARNLSARGDVLSMLLRNGERLDDPLTNAELRDNLITLLLAGHETTATTLAWAFHDLARDNGLLRRAQQAADEGDDAYLEAVAKESLRLHPVIYEVARRVTEPVRVGDYLVPAGATVMPTIGLVQDDPAFYEHPERFDPARFLDRQPAPNTWIPFGGGVRRCLGAGFSLIEATVVLREVLTRFDVAADRPGREAPRSRNITLAPARGVRVQVARRELSSQGAGSRRPRRCAGPARHLWR